MNAWREVLQRFAEGGETITEFCRREGLCTNSFRRWRTRLAATSESESAIVASRKTAAADFVDLGALGATSQPVPSAVKVEGAHRLELKLDLGAGMMLVLVRS